MTTITDAKNAIYSYLTEMGLSPSGLKIISFDTEKDDSLWQIDGKFQEGFMGNYYKFIAKYNPLMKTVSKMDVEEIKSFSEGL